jgi:NAD-dependent dihydropyrimidine dehydrogenase PreA subunit
MRTYTELRKRERSSADWSEMVIFGVDCLGTLPTGEYRRKSTPGDLAELTRQSLREAAWGGSHADQYRTACQVCDWPAPWGADVTIGTIGVDNDQYLLLLAYDEETAGHLGWDDLLPRRAVEYELSRRESIVGAVAGTRLDRRNHLLGSAAGGFRFDDLASMLAWLASCSVCGNCLKACPLYQGEIDSMAGISRLSEREHTALMDLVQTSHWLASCSGCGMCEEQCKRDVSLTLFLSALSHRIRDELHYTPGAPGQRYPWVGG